ncbi:MAG: hypothetical protein AAGB34_02695 [Planctomycetota bacterium]
MAMKLTTTTLSAAAILMFAGTAASQLQAIRVDGINNSQDVFQPDFNVANENYGAPLVFQQASVIEQPVGLDGVFSAAINNANTLGVAGFNAEISPVPVESITTGIEYAISLAEAGWDGTSDIKIAGWINNGDRGFMSNHVLGASRGDFGGETTQINFADDVAWPGINHIVVPGTPVSGTATVDGVRDASYGNDNDAIFQQTFLTGFGDNQNTSPVYSVGGSEINNAFAFISDEGTPGDTADDVLYLFIGGNIEANFNKFDIFLDVAPGGQNNLLPDNPDVDFNQLNRMAEIDNNGEDEPGLTFDVGFEADYFIGFGTGNRQGEDTAEDFSDDTVEVFAHAAVIATTPSASTPGSEITPGGRVLEETVRSFTVPGPNTGGSISIGIDGSNVSGVTGGTSAGTDNPADGPVADVTTGMEFQIDLDALGWTAGDSVTLSGFITGTDGAFISNQVIGGLPANSINLGDGKTVNLANVAGTQSVTFSGTASGNDAIVDGSITSDSYPAASFENANSTTFGNNSDSSIDNSNGSEIAAVYGYVSNSGGTNLLNVLITGNLHDFNRFVGFVDFIPGEGQNLLRGDNFNAGGQLQNLGDTGANGEGITFETGFGADLAFIYQAGFNGDSSAVEHFLDAANIPTDPTVEETPSVGGRAGGGALLDGQSMIAALSGMPQEILGFRDNTDAGPSQANGSELNAFYATRGFSENEGIATEYIFFSVTGNLVDDFTKFDIFLDMDPTEGQNVLAPFVSEQMPGNSDVNNGGLRRMGGLASDPQDEQMPGIELDQPGLTFDLTPNDPARTFTATHFITLNHAEFGEIFIDNVGTGEFATRMFGDLALLGGVTGTVLGDDDQDGDRFLGSVLTGFGGNTSSGVPEGSNAGTSEAFRFNINNSNVGGVDGAVDEFGDVSDAANVTSGIEIGIPISEIGWDGSSNFKVYFHIADSNRDILSNQTLPASCATSLGDPRNVNYNDIQGDQFIELSWNATTLAFDVVNTSTLPTPCETVTQPFCPGDANDDRVINVDDFIAVLLNFGSSGAGEIVGDANGDGIVNVADFIAVLLNFGQPCPTS